VRLVSPAGGSGGSQGSGEGEGEVLEGRLEVRPTEQDEWGTVCNEVCLIIKYMLAKHRLNINYVHNINFCKVKLSGGGKVIKYC